MKKATLILLLLTMFNGHAQEDERVSLWRASFSPVELTFNLYDFYYGFSAGVDHKSRMYGARLNFQFRPAYKKVQIQESETTIRQYEEKKYFTSIDLDKRMGRIELFGMETNFFAGAKLGMLTSNYKGTKIDAPTVWIAAPFAGLCLNMNSSSLLKGGYIYMKDDLVNVPEGKLYLALQFVF